MGIRDHKSMRTDDITKTPVVHSDPGAIAPPGDTCAHARSLGHARSRSSNSRDPCLPSPRPIAHDLVMPNHRLHWLSACPGCIRPLRLLVALIAWPLPACVVDQATTSVGPAASGSSSTSTSTSTSTSGGLTSSGDMSSATTLLEPWWPPVECGDALCLEGQICVIEGWLECCYRNAASTTDTGTTGSTTDDSTSSGTEGSSTSSGGTESTTTTAATTGPGTTGEECHPTVENTYQCQNFPYNCHRFSGSALAECLAYAYCQQLWFEVEFSQGSLYCGDGPHGCYP